MAAPVLATLPNLSVRKVGEPQTYQNKKTNAWINRTEVNVEDTDGNPQVVVFDHTTLDLPKRGDTIDLHAEISFFAPKAYQVDLRITARDWAPTETGEVPNLPS